MGDYTMKFAQFTMWNTSDEISMEGVFTKEDFECIDSSGGLGYETYIIPLTKHNLELLKKIVELGEKNDNQSMVFNREMKKWEKIRWET